jgi:hypothetical protein
MNKNYVKGRAFEYRVKQYWKDGGWEGVRAAGSHSPFDVVVYKTSFTGEDLAALRAGDTRDLTGLYEYRTYITPIIGYGIQCKVRKLVKRKGKLWYHGKSRKPRWRMIAERRWYGSTRQDPLISISYVRLGSRLLMEPLLGDIDTPSLWGDYIGRSVSLRKIGSENPFL